LTNESFISQRLENPIMNRNVSLVLTIIRDAKLPAVLELGDEFKDVQYRSTWGPTGTVGLVRLNVKDLDAHADAFDWIGQHPDIKVLESLCEDPGPEDNGSTEILVVQVIDARAARARRNAEELRVKIGKRRLESRNDLGGTMPAAMAVDFHLGKVVRWEAEHECWRRIADKPEDFRAVLSSAVVDLIQGIGHSADALEDGLRAHKLEGLRSFVRRARVYMDPEDAVDALLSF
jgi:hypothetical protein